MEIEFLSQSDQISSPISTLIPSQLSILQLQTFLKDGMEELEKRYRNPSNDNEKCPTFNTTLMLRSKICLFMNTLIPKAVNLNKLTP